MTSRESMRAVVVREFGGPERLELVALPIPEPRAHQVRVRIRAAPVNPVDTQVRSGRIVEWGGAVRRPQFGLGVEFAGIVDLVGEGVRRISPGDEVIGVSQRLDLPLGAYAEYIIVEEADVAAAPHGIDAVAASTLPLNGLTAWQALDALGLKADQWLVVTGAAGGVGRFAMELAALRGLRVIGSGSAVDEEVIRGFGAEHFVSRDEVLGDTVRDLVPGGADAVLDCANLRIAAMDAVRHGGRFVSLLVNAPLARRAIQTFNVAYHADLYQLNLLSALGEAGRLTPSIATTCPLEQAQQAHEAIEGRSVRGRRLVLVP